LHNTLIYWYIILIFENMFRQNLLLNDRLWMDKNYKLLIIDDNEELLAALISYFTLRGYHVVSASSGLEGLKLLETDTEGIDLLITDLVMPSISGVGIISIAKKRDPNFPIIAITGWGKFPEALAEEAKADKVLKKPFQLSHLEKIVTDLLDKNQ